MKRLNEDDPGVCTDDPFFLQHLRAHKETGQRKLIFDSDNCRSFQLLYNPFFFCPSLSLSLSLSLARTCLQKQRKSEHRISKRQIYGRWVARRLGKRKGGKERVCACATRFLSSSLTGASSSSQNIVAERPLSRMHQLD